MRRTAPSRTSGHIAPRNEPGGVTTTLVKPTPKNQRPKRPARTEMHRRMGKLRVSRRPHPAEVFDLSCERRCGGRRLQGLVGQHSTRRPRRRHSRSSSSRPPQAGPLSTSPPGTCCWPSRTAQSWHGTRSAPQSSASSPCRMRVCSTPPSVPRPGGLPGARNGQRASSGSRRLPRTLPARGSNPAEPVRSPRSGCECGHRRGKGAGPRRGYRAPRSCSGRGPSH